MSQHRAVHESSHHDGHEFIKKPLTDDHDDTRTPDVSAGDSQSHRHHKRHNTDRIDEQLTQIYENTDGSMPDMTRFQKRERSRFVRAVSFLVFSCLILGGVAFGGMTLLRSQLGFSERAVSVSISGDESVTVGQEVHYRVRYRNSQSVPLAKAVLQVRYPEGFVFTGSSERPTNDTNDEWVIGAVSAHDSGSIDIHGVLYGDAGNEQSVRAFLNYTPSNFNSEFQSVATLSTLITTGQASVVLKTPADVTVGKEVSFTAVVHRSTTASLPLALDLNIPQFRVTKSEPSPDAPGGYRWTIPQATDTTVVVRGIFTSTSDMVSVSPSAQLFVWKDAQKTTQPYLISSSTQTVALLSTTLATAVVINGGSGGDITVQPGEALHSSITVKNTDTVPLSDVEVRMVFDAPSYENKSLLNWAKLQDENNGNVVGEQLTKNQRRGTITWTKKEISALSRLDAGEEIVIDFELPLKGVNDVSDLSLYPSGAIIATTNFRYTRNKTPELFTGAPMTLTVLSDLTLSTEHTVSARDGKETHTVQWVLNNTFHDLKDIRLEADVYGDVTWLDDVKEVSAGTVEYRPSEKKVVWTIPQMPTSVDVLALQFGILLNAKNPTQTQLMSKVRLKATDTVAGQDIMKAGDEILLSSS